MPSENSEKIERWTEQIIENRIAAFTADAEQPEPELLRPIEERAHHLGYEIEFMRFSGRNLEIIWKTVNEEQDESPEIGESW